jgi:hypothetical protein
MEMPHKKRPQLRRTNALQQIPLSNFKVPYPLVNTKPPQQIPFNDFKVPFPLVNTKQQIPLNNFKVPFPLVNTKPPQQILFNNFKVPFPLHNTKPPQQIPLVNNKQQFPFNNFKVSFSSQNNKPLSRFVPYISPQNKGLILSREKQIRIQLVELMIKKNNRVNPVDNPILKPRNSLTQIRKITPIITNDNYVLASSLLSMCNDG